MKIYYAVSSNGDGSSSVSFYDSQEAIDLLREKLDYYTDGDGGSGGDFEITGDNIKTTLDIRTLADAQEEVEEWGEFQ